MGSCTSGRLAQRHRRSPNLRRDTPPDCIAALAFDSSGRVRVCRHDCRRCHGLPAHRGESQAARWVRFGVPCSRRWRFTPGTKSQGVSVREGSQGIASLESRIRRRPVFPLPGGVEASSRTQRRELRVRGRCASGCFRERRCRLHRRASGILRWQLEKGTYDVVAANPADAMTVADFGAGGRRALTIDRQFGELGPVWRTVTLAGSRKSTARLLTSSVTACAVTRLTVWEHRRDGRRGRRDPRRPSRSGEPHELLGHNGPVFSVGQSRMAAGSPRPGG